MKKTWLDSGRIETVVALLVLGAVLALFLKFHRPDTPVGPSTVVPTAAPVGPTTSPPSQ